MKSSAARIASMIVLSVSFVHAQRLVVTPTALTFNATADIASAPSQTVTVTSTGIDVPFWTFPSTVFSNVGPGSSFPVFAAVSPSSGMTPATLTLSLIDTREVKTLRPGTYQSGIYFSQSPTLDLSANYTYTGVYLQLVAPPPTVVSGIVNAATLQPGPVAPGEIVSIFGANLASPFGSLTLRESYPPAGTTWTASLSSGGPLPQLFASPSQLNAIIPFGIAGRPAMDFQIVHFASRGIGATQAVTDTSPGIFTLTQTGNGQGAILNSDNSVNGIEHPAKSGSIVQIFGTGAGLMNPPQSDGVLYVPPRPPFLFPVAHTSVSIGGKPATLTYVGAAPNLVVGVLQVNAVIPDGIGPGPQPVVLTIGSNSNSNQLVTVFVQ